MAQRHTYLKTHTLAGAMLSFALSAEDAGIRERAQSAKSGRVAKTLVKEGRLRVTLIAMRNGSRLGAHQVEGVVSVQVMRGRARVSAGGASIDVAANGLLVLQEEVSHTLEALADCALLVTVAMSAEPN